MSVPWDCYRFRGSAEAVGSAQGECFSTSLKAMLALRFDAMAETLGATANALMERFEPLARLQWELLEKLHPMRYDELKALCRAGGVDALAYVLAVNMTDVRDHGDPEGCTSWVMSLPEHGYIGAQTWDLGVENLDHVVAVDKAIEGESRVISLSCAGFPPLVGMNEHGLCVGTTNIKVKDRGEGLGYQHLIDGMLQCPSVAQAQERLHLWPRLGTHTYWLLDSLGGAQCDFGFEHEGVEALVEEPLVRTNHPLSEVWVAKQLEPPQENSIRRLAKAKALLKHCKDLNDVEAVLCDRSEAENSISRWPEDGTGITTNGCVMALPQQRSLYLCRGDKNRHDWLRLSFDSEMEA